MFCREDVAFGGVAREQDERQSECRIERCVGEEAYYRVSRYACIPISYTPCGKYLIPSFSKLTFTRKGPIASDRHLEIENCPQ